MDIILYTLHVIAQNVKYKRGVSWPTTILLLYFSIKFNILAAFNNNGMRLILIN